MRDDVWMTNARRCRTLMHGHVPAIGAVPAGNLPIPQRGKGEESGAERVRLLPPLNVHLSPEKGPACRGMKLSPAVRTGLQASGDVGTDGGPLEQAYRRAGMSGQMEGRELGCRDRWRAVRTGLQASGDVGTDGGPLEQAYRRAGMSGQMEGRERGCRDRWRAVRTGLQASGDVGTDGGPLEQAYRRAGMSGQMEGR
ncbi:hypothetical protein Bbelb_224340 [Branchiostoma belcheri]|nr:hypothetical protein Bbelb_224340 [Branchiostoma belcheri]